MTSGMQTVIYPVENLGSAKEIFSRLFGVEPYVDQPYYIGFRVDGQEAGLDPSGHDGNPIGLLQDAEGA